MNHKFLKCAFLFIIFSTTTAFDDSHAKRTRSPPVSEIPISNYQNSNTSTTSTHQWRNTQLAGAQRLLDTNLKPNLPFILAGILSFMAAVISSAGGIGGGGLFIPILTIVAGLELKTASSFSAFMVTGGSTANVACHMFAGGSRKRGGGVLINYDIALLSEPCMLLGVSCGVICNLIFPEWLTTIIFANFLAFSTFKTCKSGVLYWKLESEGAIRRNGGQNSGNGEDFVKSTKVPLLSEEPNTGGKLKMIPWMKLGMLVIIWFSFLLLYLLRGNRYGQGLIHMKACGKVYWIISSIQIPFAILFTAWILYGMKCPKDSSSRYQENGDERNQSSEKLLFPIMALLAGVLGGVFGIGGGMLISPLLLQMGMEPEVTAATCSFMVLFSSTMSAVQYLMLGMEDIYGALAYAIICFVASVVGLTLVQRAIMKHGRASVIVFSVGTVMALSTVLMTSFGAVDIWRDYTSGKSMGFKRPC